MIARFIALGFLALTACSGGGAAESPSKPAVELTGRVVDEAELLDPESEMQLTKKLQLAEQQFGQQLVVVTVKSLNNREIEDFSLDLANAWKIGSAERDDGLMLLVAPVERKVRIEVGYGLEASFSDEFCKSIIDENMLPKFSKGEFQQGISEGVDRLIEKMKAVPSLPANDNTPKAEKEEAA